MFGINKKVEQDPKKALENADKTLNKGVSGFLTKTFMGKDFTDKMNAGLAQANNAVNMADSSNQLAMTGVPATAEVKTIADTGTLINYNPVVKMNLHVVPQFGVPFDTSVETMVSKIAIPRVGDKINIKYNPANLSQVLVL
jgi:hypothetical protein